MSRKHKRSGTPMRAVRSIRELGTPAGDGDYEINDGEEFQARDGSNVLTFAEAEAAERREVQERRAAMRMAATTEIPVRTEPERSIQEILWSIITSPGRLVVDLVRITMSPRKEGKAS